MDLARPNDLLQSDLEEEAQRQEQQRNAVQFALDRLGELLEHADATLTRLEEDNDGHALGSAIVRGCQDLADAVGHLATQIDEQSEDDRRALAQACIEDAQNSLLLQQERVNSDSWHSLPNYQEQPSNQELVELSRLSEDHVMTAIQAAGSLLRDVESTLRAIDRNEADEIADVALTAAHLFVMSLKSVHDSLTPEDCLRATTQLAQEPSTSTTIEVLDDDEIDDFERVYPASRRSSKQENDKNRNKRLDRLRVLWPPLGPAVMKACNWGKETASQKPLLAVALGITLWPAAVLTAFIGAPIVVADGILQNLYQNFHEGPVIQGIERSAAQLYHTGRLSLLCGKLVGRQTLRVVNRQVERHGGVGKIAHDLGGLAIDRVTHPVETVSMALSGVSWGFGVARETWRNLMDQERDETVQRLQQ